MDDLFQRLEQSTDTARALLVQNLICKISEFTASFKITRDWTAPSDPEALSLAEKLHKIGRYRVISERLQKAARRYSMFSTVRFLPVEKIALDTAIVKSQIPSYSDLAIKHDRLLRSLPGRATIETRLRNEHDKLRHPKVHCEIQLLLF